MNLEQFDNQNKKEEDKTSDKMSRRNFLIESLAGAACLLTGCENKKEQSKEGAAKNTWSEEMKKEHERENNEDREKEEKMHQAIKKFAKTKGLSLDDKKINFEYKMKESQIESLIVNGKNIPLNEADRKFLTDAYMEANYGKINSRLKSPSSSNSSQGKMYTDPRDL